MILPEEAVAKILHTEVDRTANLTARLRGGREYPIEVNLKLPTSRQILSDTVAFESFVRAWNAFPQQEFVKRTDVSFKNGVQGQGLPQCLSVPDLEGLLSLLPKAERLRIGEVRARVAALGEITGCRDARPFYSLYARLRPETLGEQDFSSLMKLMPQLSRGMGQGLYLRALPLKGIDTKFVERHQSLIESVLILGDIMSPEESLEEFLQVEPRPDGFAHIRVLDQSLSESYPYMMVPVSELMRRAPLGRRLVIVENVQSGLMLAKLQDTAVIFWCGKNLSFAAAPWLKDKERIVYWGDLDSWGLQMLADFRALSGLDVPSAMMDLETIEYGDHAQRMVRERESTEPDVGYLTGGERAALLYLKEHPGANRLEQEKLDQDYVGRKILEALEN